MSTPAAAGAWGVLPLKPVSKM